MDERVILPPKYYHDNFEYLLNFVKDKYKDLLNPNEWTFLRKYYSLPENAQCLFIRFTNRKGLFFKTDGLKYEEIGDLEKPLAKLKVQEFISELNPELHISYINEILYLLTKNDLLQVFDLKTYKNLKKEELSEIIKTEFGAEEIIQKIASKIPIIKLNFEFEVNFIKFLFFGNKMMDMTEFVLRDMGLVQYFHHNDDDLVARFETRKEAEDKWIISDQYLIFDNLKTSASTVEIYDWFLNFQASMGEISEIAKPSFQKLTLRIAKFFEQQKQYEFAIDLYDFVEIVPARERKARSLVKIGHIEEAKFLCNQMIEKPLNVDESYFAEYFLKTIEGKKSKKKTTEWLSAAQEISVSKVYQNQVELGAINHFIDHDFEAGFSENYTWRSLFGLWFWDIIFDPSLVSFHHPFQRRPSDLHLPDFYEKRYTQIHTKLNEFEDSSDLLAYLWLNFVKHIDTANPFVVWLEEVWEMVRVLVIKIDLDKLKLIMIKIAENLVENSRGLPDLLVWNEDFYELVEIKSPNDSLSHQQLFWLKYFQEIGVNARVLRVKFIEY